MSGKSTPSKMVEWMCRYCGQKRVSFKSNGRPMPGRCAKRKNDMPHSWVKNREFEKPFGM